MTSNADITIFNRRYDASTRQDRLIPTIIRGCSLYMSNGSSGSLQNRSPKASYKIRIPIDADAGGKCYIDGNAYKNLDDDEAWAFWTLQPDCVIVPYAVEEAEGVTITELTKMYGSVITVTDYSDNTTRGTQMMKHWRIGGE